MRQNKLSITACIVACFVLIVTAACQNSGDKMISKPVNDSDGFAVMELFTSQGCSSCPPADNLLGKYANLGNHNIMALAFHVDYWNRLGWTDSFSSPKYSKRQRDYAMTIGNSSVYTPQLVINGEKELVGSDAGKISILIANELKVKATVHISIDKIERDMSNIKVNFKLDKPVKFTTVQAALVQKQLVTNILRGENNGVRLTNYNVVRDFNSIASGDSSSSIGLRIPAGFKDADFIIVLYTQDDSSGRITGAVQKAL